MTGQWRLIRDVFLAAALLLKPPAAVAQDDTGGMRPLQSNFCTNWQATQAALLSAKSKWTQPPCYDFSYTFRGFQVGVPSPKTVKVRNGAVTGGTGDKTMTDFFNMIESLCVTSCPTVGAFQCNAKYNSTQGYPESIFIDMQEFSVDEERIYRLTDFVVVDCTGTTSLQLVEAENDTLNQACSTASQSIAANWTEAMKVWANPLCYDFTYKLLNSEAIEVKVRNGVALNNETSLVEWMRKIEMNCINATCSNDHDEAIIHDCNITYAVEGYPTNISLPAGETGNLTSVFVSNFTVLECDDDTTDSHRSTSAPTYVCPKNK
jgi:hypothetical protein